MEEKKEETKVATKACKKCKEQINAKAKKCPHCGAKQGMPTFLIIVLVIVGIIILGSIFGEDRFSEGEGGSPSSEERVYTPVSVDELEDALENNAAVAKDTYKGKYFAVTGKLGTIDSDLKYIGLDSPTKSWDLVGIHCTIKNSQTKDVVKSLSKDQIIIVKGKITDVGEVLGYYLDIDEIIPQ